MDKARITGAAESISGSIKRAFGRLLGNTSLETKGKIEGASGAVHTAVGEMKDTVKDKVTENSH